MLEGLYFCLEIIADRRNKVKTKAELSTLDLLEKKINKKIAEIRTMLQEEYDVAMNRIGSDDRWQNEE